MPTRMPTRMPMPTSTPIRIPMPTRVPMPTRTLTPAPNRTPPCMPNCTPSRSTLGCLHVPMPLLTPALHSRAPALHSRAPALHLRAPALHLHTPTLHLHAPYEGMAFLVTGTCPTSTGTHADELVTSSSARPMLAVALTTALVPPFRGSRHAAPPPPALAIVLVTACTHYQPCSPPH
ncbi:hypothetical protein OF83DRAFT_1174481 [Amylostereum chailletii]|nr:hypothetical protein OF83DRAFT_1174481 [Amylostereum chailletii]